MAIREAEWNRVKLGRFECRMNFNYNREWQNRFYHLKQVRPIFIETPEEILVVTVYTYFFDQE